MPVGELCLTVNFDAKLTDAPCAIHDQCQLQK